MSESIRELGKIRETVLSTGLDISYAYDDLVFSENNVFILRFDDRIANKLYLYFNSDCFPDEAKIFTTRLSISGKIGGFQIVKSGTFSLNQKEDSEEIEIEFQS